MFAVRGSGKLHCTKHAAQRDISKHTLGMLLSSWDFSTEKRLGVWDAKHRDAAFDAFVNFTAKSVLETLY